MIKPIPNSIFREVEQILKKVEQKGDRALEFYIRKFDKIHLPADRFSISYQEMKSAYHRISHSVRSALLASKRRIEFFHKEELKRISKSWTIHFEGMSVGQRVSPLSSVALYIPGGRTCYPSTVLMTAIPARVAGVKEIVMVTPPGNVRDEVMAAAFLCQVDRLFRVGGPASIAALAFGTQTIPKVEKIVGPGNLYVTEAKRQLFGRVGIDGLAGPSEVAVWADSSAKRSSIVLNLLAQSEHDPSSRAFLFSKDKKLLDQVRNDIPRKFLKQIEFIFEKKERDLIRKINAIAPEHLYLAIQKPREVLSKISNVGAIFLGEKSSVALGDYVAGPSHVLPTGKSAKFSSGLSVKDFLKWSSLIENRSKNSAKIFKVAKTLAEVEGLRYHALSLKQ